MTIRGTNIYEKNATNIFINIQHLKIRLDTLERYVQTNTDARRRNMANDDKKTLEDDSFPPLHSLPSSFVSNPPGHSQNFVVLLQTAWLTQITGKVASGAQNFPTFVSHRPLSLSKKSRSAWWQRHRWVFTSQERRREVSHFWAVSVCEGDGSQWSPWFSSPSAREEEMTRRMVVAKRSRFLILRRSEIHEKMRFLWNFCPEILHGTNMHREQVNFRECQIMEATATFFSCPEEVIFRQFNPMIFL